MKRKEDDPVISRPWGMYGTAAQEAIMDYRVNEKDSHYVEKRPSTGWRNLRDWGDDRYYGEGSVTGGAIWIMRPISWMALPSTGRSGIRKWRRGLIMSKRLQASVDR